MEAIVAAKRVLMVGGGSMATAIMEGVRASEAERGGDGGTSFCVVEPSAGRRDWLRSAGFTDVRDSLVEVGGGVLGVGDDGFDAVVVAVKPQVFPTVADEAEELARSVGGVEGGRGVLLVSVMAGLTIGRIGGLWPGSARVVRVMPNTPARLRLGCSAMAVGDGVSEAEASMVESMFSGVGLVFRIDEGRMDAFTGLAGSGPAYVFAFAEALIGAGVAAGLEGEAVDSMVRQLLLGSAQMLVSSDVDGGGSPDIGGLRERVTSPGGTTAAGLKELSSGDLAGLVSRAVLAARDRGRELSGAETA